MKSFRPLKAGLVLNIILVPKSKRELIKVFPSPKSGVSFKLLISDSSKSSLLLSFRPLKAGLVLNLVLL